jgi:hypothetical protein
VLLPEKEQVTSDQWIIRAYIAVGSHATDSRGRILLSPDCVTTTELNTWADMLIKDLQDIRKKAARLQWDNRSSRGGQPSN